MNQVTHECLGKKLKSYLRVEGRTKPLKSALDKILSLPTYGKTDEPSHPKVPWSKFKSYPRVEGRTNPLMGALIKKFKSYLWVEG